MKRRVLLAVYEAPGFGGASTSQDSLHARMQKDGIDSHLVLIIRRSDRAFYEYTFGESWSNPGSLANVHVHWVDDTSGHGDADLRDLVLKIGPDVVECRGYVAAHLIGVAAGHLPMVYSLVGIPETSALSRDRPGEISTVIDAYAGRSRTPTLLSAGQMQAFLRSSLVVANSDLTLEACRALLPHWLSVRLHHESLSSVEWMVEQVRGLGVEPLPFEQRDIDLLLVASSWNRWEKNYPLVRELVEGCPDLRIHLVGHCDSEIPSTTHHGLIGDRSRVLELMARAKVLVCPSRVDAAPGVLFEGALMGCNPVASKNCGNWQICDERLVVETYTSAGFEAAARLATREAYPNHLEDLVNDGSYDRLLEILEFCE